VLLGNSGEQEEVSVFRALFFLNEPEIVLTLNRYYQQLYDLLEQGIAHFAEKPQEAPEAKQAAALLFPCLDGYVTTSTLLSLDRQTIAHLLAQKVWKISCSPITIHQPGF
jgi:hypothetical protein